MVSWIDDVRKAAEVVKRGAFKAVTHGGVAHMDDVLAAALLHKHGAEAVYRLNAAEEIAKLDGDVILFDIGDAFRDALPQRFVVLDHHGVADPSEEPSTIVQVAAAVDLKPRPLVATLLHYVDLYDRFGPAVKRWSGPYGNSLNNGVAKYLAEATPTGLVKETKFLELLAEALYSRLELDIPSFAEAFKLAEKLPFADLAEKFPRTFNTLRLMLAAAKDVQTAATGKEALETGFGVDFGCYAVLAVPELEQYVAKGLERHYLEARRAAEAAASGRYTIVKGHIAAVAVEDYLPPGPIWNALQDLGVLSTEPVFIVVKDRRNPGAYTLWRPDRHANVIDFRRLQGPEVVFKHASGFLAVVKAENAEQAARYAQAQL
ncbi:hypothetical protein [Pyrobaculum neutrophilum]|uniref:Uncharacterized protein n=1 Tax=Pyrobaculum neutrophilum (strain DSM 2338 / JCM 9278 / NBRC 100436 / V24Sta) TaxID=444157 RepID=B1YB72_PYRNV|nr:hypothetical protein [Pyrobaculum neutrophilum]ACB39203.1 conserved hypothetical protein [Pyrobaculum neutrophilum V24Sta]